MRASEAKEVIVQVALVQLCLSSSCVFLARLRNDCECNGRPHPHDDLHPVGGGLALPGLHPLLCPKGLVRHLRHHVRAELYSLCPQLQATGLLERGLEAAAAGQAGLRAVEGPARRKTTKQQQNETRQKQNNIPREREKQQQQGERRKKCETSEHLTCYQETLLPNNVYSAVC